MDEPRTEELAALERLAKAATPGPWHAVIDEPMERGGTRSYVGAADRFKYICPADADNAAYIAAVSPDVVLALIEQVRAASRPAVRDGLDVDLLAEAMHVWTNHEPDGSQALHLTDHHQLGDSVRRDAAGIAREYAALAASRPAVGELDVERLARAIHEVLPEDGDPEHEDNGEPYCEYIAAAIAGRYDDPEWVALADKGSPESEG